MSLSNVLSTRRGKNGEVDAAIQAGGYVSYALPSGTTTTSLATNTQGLNASHLLLTNPASAVSTATLTSTGLQRGAVKKIGFGPSGVSITLASVAGNQIVNGTTIVNSIQCVLANTGATVYLQYIGSGTWRLLEVNGTVTIA